MGIAQRFLPPLPIVQFAATYLARREPLQFPRKDLYAVSEAPWAQSLVICLQFVEALDSEHVVDASCLCNTELRHCAFRWRVLILWLPAVVHVWQEVAMAAEMHDPFLRDLSLESF